MSITVKQLENEVRRLARKYPNAEYQRDPDFGFCNTLGSVKNGPLLVQGCIIGQAFVNLGVSKALLRNMENGTAQTLIQTYCSDLCYSRWFNIVQKQQDNGKNWSEAVQIADKVGNDN